jgi:hypothetical protein
MTTQDYSGIVRTIDLAWAAGTATPDAAADYVVFLDATDGALKRCLVSAIGGGGGAGTIKVEDVGGLKGTRPTIRFLKVGALTLNVTDDAINNRVNVSYSFVKSTAEEVLASTTVATDKLPYYDSSLTAATTTLTSFGRSLIDDADAAAARTTMGLASIASTGSASDLSTGTVPTARLATGSATSATYLRGDQTWAAIAGVSGASGVTTIDFGAFPGGSDASVTITGQTGIDASSSQVQAWLMAQASDDHTADEHRVETLSVMAGNMITGVGFTIYAQNTSQTNEPLDIPGNNQNRNALTMTLGTTSPSVGGQGTRIYGKWNVAWKWS